MAEDKKKVIKDALSKIKMKDVGTKIGGEMPVKSVSEDSSKKYYPCVYLSSDLVPSLDGCKVGDEETMVIKVRIKSISERESGSEKKKDYSLDILEMGKEE